MRRPPFAVLWTASLIALHAPSVWGVQNDPDVRPGWEAKAQDIAYTEDGTAVLAFVRRSNTQDEVVVRSSQDLGRTWQTLWANTIGNVTTIEQVSVAVAQGGPSNVDDRVFVGLLGTWDDPNNPMAFHAILHGESSKTPWTSFHCLDVADGWYSVYSPEMSIHCATVPIVGQGPQDYAVGLAYTWPLGAARALFMAWSTDHGDSLHHAAYIAGPGAATLDLDHAFANPTFVGDTTNREIILAVQDDNDGVIHLLAAPTAQHLDQTQDFRTVWQTPAGGDRELSATVAVYQGEINLACLIEPVNSQLPGWELTMYHGDTLSGQMTELAHPTTGRRLAQGVLSGCDLITRRSDFFLCTLVPESFDIGIVTGHIVAFEGNKRDLSELVEVRVSDDVLFISGVVDPSFRSPRVGVAPVAASPRRAQSYSWLDADTMTTEVVIDP